MLVYFDNFGRDNSGAVPDHVHGEVVQPEHQVRVFRQLARLCTRAVLVVQARQARQASELGRRRAIQWRAGSLLLWNKRAFLGYILTADY